MGSSAGRPPGSRTSPSCTAGRRSRPAPPAENVRISIANTGFVGEESRAAKELWFRHWHAIMNTVGKVRGWGEITREQYDRDAHGEGAIFVGGPEEIAERIVDLQRRVGHMRQFFNMDLGSVPHREYLRSIELLGTRVKPLVDAELAATSQPR